MPIETPPVKPTAPTPPDRSDRANFPTQMYDEFVFLNGDFIDYVEAAGANVENNATEAAASAAAGASSASAAATSESNAAASAATAASAASVAAWVNGATYALNAAAISQLDYQTYRKITASSVTTTDPAADSTNWSPLGWLRTVTVTGTTHTAALGTRALLTNVAATAVTAPSATDGAEFEVVPGNGLLTNTVDFGAKTLRGPFGEASGVITLNLGTVLRARFISTLDKWVVML